MWMFSCKERMEKMNELKVFENNEFGKIRTFVKDGEPWFVGKDVAEILGYTNSRDALSKRVDDEDKGVANCDTLGGSQDLTVINESGLYSLILSSKLPKAKKFKRWITSEVLPTIRKTGQYQITEFPQKASSIGEIVQLGKLIKELMKEQNASPYQVAEVVVDTLNKFGLNLNNVLLPVKLEKVKDDELDMVEFAATFPNSTYQDYLLYRTMVKTSR